MTATAAPTAVAQLSVGGAFTVGKMSEGRVLALAAVAPVGSDDQVDELLGRALQQDRPDLAVPCVNFEDFDPATPERRYSVLRVNDFPLKDEAHQDVVIMRGELSSVLKRAAISRKNRSLVQRNADFMIRRGWRPLAVATALVGPGDAVGEFRFQGFLNVGVGNPRGSRDTGPADWARVNVWSLSLRLQHWINVVTIFTLSCTGYLIMDPFFGPEAHSGESTGYLMGWIRLIHIAAGCIWVVVGASRLVSAFTSRDPHLRWTQWWPLKRKQDVRNITAVVKHYAFIGHDEPLFLAHNPLQQLTYTLLYAACGVQMLTGFALFGLYHQDNPFWAFVATPIHIFGIPGIRLFHTMMMFFLWAFVIVHVYLAVRADSLDRHGGISSMINGGVWLRRGAKPLDAPEVG